MRHGLEPNQLLLVDIATFFEAFPKLDPAKDLHNTD